MKSGLQGEVPSGAGPSATRRRLALRLFHRFVDRDEAGRREALRTLQARDPAIAREVESLLGHFDRAEAAGFLAGPVTDPGPPPTEADDVSAPLPPGQPLTEPTEDCDDLPPGTRVGRHVLGEVIGRGGMGVVYLGRRVDDFDQVVAVKVVGRRLSPSAARRFHLERKLLALMEHPNIVRLLDGGDAEDGLPYLVMDFIDGASLAVEATDVRPSPRACAALLEPIVGATAYAHETGVVHRDIKPSNILVGRDGTPRLTDFGLARPLVDEGTGTLTGDGSISGTPGYMAPEQILGGPGRHQPAVDVYALGAVLYFLLMGRPPHEGETPFETCKRALEADPEPIRRQRPSVPRDLETIAATAMAREPSRRYATARAMGDDLRRFLAGEPVVARRTSIAERAGRRLLRHRRTAAVAAVVALAAAIAAFAGLSRWNRDLARKNDSLRDLAKAYAATIERIAHRGALGDPRFDADFAHFSQAIEAVLHAGGDEAELVDLRYAAALAQYQLGRSHQFARRKGQAEECYRRSIDALRDLSSAHPGRHDIRYDLFRGLFNLADLMNAERPADADALHRESLAVIESLSRDVPADLDYVDAVAAQHYNLGRAIALNGMSEGEGLLRRAAAIAEDLRLRPGAKPRYIRPAGLAWGDLSMILHRSGRDGEDEARRAVAAYDLLVREVPDDAAYRDEYAARLELLAVILADRGEHAQAEALLDRAVSQQGEAISQRPQLVDFVRHLATALQYRAEVRLARGRVPEALADFADADARLAAWMGDRDDADATESRIRMAARSAPLTPAAADRLSATLPPGPLSIDARILLVRAHMARGRFAEALALATTEAPPEARESPPLQILAATAEAKLGRREAAAARLQAVSSPAHQQEGCLFVARLRRDAAEAVASPGPP